MPDDSAWEKAVREAAYLIWQREGRPEGRAMEHWLEAARETQGEEEKVLERCSDANIPRPPDEGRARRMIRG